VSTRLVLLLKKIGLCVLFCALLAIYIQQQPLHKPFVGIPTAAVTHAYSNLQPSPAPPVAGQLATVSRTGAQDWGKAFYSANDYFDFVSRAAGSAVAGDGRAAFYISEAVRKCSAIVALYGRTSDPEAAFNAEWNDRPHAPAWVVDKARNDFRLCSGFLKGNAFKDLPQRAGGYDGKYWLDQAYNDGDPLAQIVHAAGELGKAHSPNSSTGDVALLQSAQTDVNNAVASADPKALFKIGTLISNGHGIDRIQGFAVSLAACDLGYDCAAASSNDEIFGACVLSSSCAPGLAFSDIVVQAIGDDGYAQAYSRAQQIEDALKRGDMNAVQAFVQLRHPT
jgi:hypothetical protein